MSPLRYRCATGPWRFYLIFILFFAITAPLEKPARIALATRLRFSRLHLVRFSHSACLIARREPATYLSSNPTFSRLCFGRVPQARGVFYLIFNISAQSINKCINFLDLCPRNFQKLFNNSAVFDSIKYMRKNQVFTFCMITMLNLPLLLNRNFFFFILF